MKNFKEQLMEWATVTEKQKFNTSTNSKKLSDDDLMDFIDWLENLQEPNPDNKDQFNKAMKDAKKELKKRGFK